MRRITFYLWANFADGSRSCLDILDWEPNYNGTVRDTWRYAWSVFRANMRDPSSVNAESITWSVSGR